MQNVVFILLRRMRAPLIVLIVTYAVAVLGLVLIPGMDARGEPWRMDFFHAFYFVSFMGSTIGFGEIPYPFTGAQRMWTLVTIYASVFAWLYAIGTMLSVLQDRAFWRVVHRTLFVKAVHRIAGPFYVVCGYGDTGDLLVHALAERRIGCVVLDRDQERIDALEVGGLPTFVPGLTADAADPDALRAAGLVRPNCKGVLGVTGSERVNLGVAISSKLMAPSRMVISRAEYADTAANLESFGTDHVVNPFDEFASRFALAIHSPSMYLLDEWMTSPDDAKPVRPVTPPRGTWVLCGFGRFGKAVQLHLSLEGVGTVIVEAQPEATGAPADAVRGRGTEAVTLREAGIERAVGLIAGTDDDTNNLSIIVTARELNENLFVVARQNLRRNSARFESAWVDVVMDPGRIIARRVLAYITTPLLPEFLAAARRQNEEWANVLVSRVAGTIGEDTPLTWTLSVDLADARAVAMVLAEGGAVTVGELLTDPRDRRSSLCAVALLLVRSGDTQLLPGPEASLRPGDRLLLCGSRQGRDQLLRIARDHGLLDYVRLGVDRPQGYIWRWLTGRRAPIDPPA